MEVIDVELRNIKGNTYWIQAPTNIGVYVVEEGKCLLIDTGLNEERARKIDSILSMNGLYPKYIFNTHGHPDHCGGNHYFRRKYPDVIIGASRMEKFYMENPEYHVALLNLAGPFATFKSDMPHTIDILLENGVYEINNKKMTIITLVGHTLGQIGVITPERVCFVGDAVFSKSLIEKFSLLYLFDIGKSIKTMRNVKKMDADYFVLGHGERVFNKDEFMELCEMNIRNIEMIEKQIVEFLAQPALREEILQNIMIQNNIELTLKEYSIIFFTLTVFLKYLYNKRLIDYFFDNGKLYYKRV